MRSFMICTALQILFGCSYQEGEDGRGMWYIWGEERCMQNLVGKKQRKRSLVRPSCRWEDNIEMNL